MAKAYNATCLVLKHTKLGETDSIVTLVSNEGQQIRAVAKGLRKPGNRIGARLQLFAEVDLLLHAGRSLDIVTEAKTVNTNSALRESLEHTAAASVIAELLEKLGRDGVQLEPVMYDMSSAAFRMLEALPAEQTVLITAAYMLKAMAMQGFTPAVHECALCGESIESVAVFDISYGGALCDACSSRLGINGSVRLSLVPWVDALLHCTFAELAEVKGAPARELLELAQAWLREHLALDLKSIVFLKSIM